jgi:hypothetical protein
MLPLSIASVWVGLDAVFVDFEFRFGRAGSERGQHGHRRSQQRHEGGKQKRARPHREPTFLVLDVHMAIAGRRA